MTALHFIEGCLDRLSVRRVFGVRRSRTALDYTCPVADYGCGLCGRCLSLLFLCRPLLLQLLLSTLLRLESHRLIDDRQVLDTQVHLHRGADYRTELVFVQSVLLLQSVDRLRQLLVGFALCLALRVLLLECQASLTLSIQLTL